MISCCLLLRFSLRSSKSIIAARHLFVEVIENTVDQNTLLDIQDNELKAMAEAMLPMFISKASSSP